MSSDGTGDARKSLAGFGSSGAGDGAATAKGGGGPSAAATARGQNANNTTTTTPAVALGPRTYSISTDQDDSEESASTDSNVSSLRRLTSAPNIPQVTATTKRTGAQLADKGRMTVEAEMVSALPTIAVGGGSTGGGNSGGSGAKDGSAPGAGGPGLGQSTGGMTGGGGIGGSVNGPAGGGSNAPNASGVGNGAGTGSFTGSGAGNNGGLSAPGPVRDLGAGPGLKVKRSTDSVPRKSEARSKKQQRAARYTGVTKAELFAARVASAMDEAQSSDSDETFVYESNPPEPSAQQQQQHQQQQQQQQQLPQQGPSPGAGPGGMPTSGVASIPTRPRLQSRNLSSSSVSVIGDLRAPESTALGGASSSTTAAGTGSSTSSTGGPGLSVVRGTTLNNIVSDDPTATIRGPRRGQTGLPGDAIMSGASTPALGSGHTQQQQQPQPQPQQSQQQPRNTPGALRERDSFLIAKDKKYGSSPRRPGGGGAGGGGRGLAGSTRQLTASRNFDTTSAKTANLRRWRSGGYLDVEEDVDDDDMDDDADEDEEYFAGGAPNELTPLRKNPPSLRRLRRNGRGSIYSPHNYSRKQPRHWRLMIWITVLGSVVFGAACLMALIFATSKPLEHVSVSKIFDVLVSDEELAFEIVVEASNPGFFAVDISTIDIDVFARSEFVDTLIKISDASDSNSIDNFDSSDAVTQDNASTLEVSEKPKKEHTMLLGNVGEFEVPLSFEGSLFHHHVLKTVGDIKLSNPGRNTTGSDGSSSSESDFDLGQKRWAKINTHPFDLIIRGALRYELQFGREKLVSVEKSVRVNPNKDPLTAI